MPQHPSLLTFGAIGALAIALALWAPVRAAMFAEAQPGSAEARMQRHCDWEACATYRCAETGCELAEPFKY
jgi:hypothetical protein